MKILSELIAIAEEAAANTAERHGREGAAFGKDVKAGKHAKLTDAECRKYSPAFLKAYKEALSEAQGDKDDVTYTHSNDCEWSYGGDCDCGKKTRDHAKHCMYSYGKDCTCGMSWRPSYSEAVELDEAGPKPWAEGTEAWELGKKHSIDGKGSCPYPADSKLGKKYWAGFTEGTATKKRLKDQGKVVESADLARDLVRGDRYPKGLMNRLDHWLRKLMFTKDKNRFEPAAVALKALRSHGFSEEQITMIRDAAMDAAYTAVETMQKKHGDRVPAKYISKLPSSFGVFDLFLNVSEEIHEEYAALMRKLFDAKIAKIAEKLNIVKEGWGDYDRRSFKRKELEAELGHEDRAERNRTFTPVKYGIEIDGKLWMRDGKAVDFRSKATAEKSAATIAGRGKKAVVVPLNEDSALQSLGKDLTSKAVSKARASAEIDSSNEAPADEVPAEEAPVPEPEVKSEPAESPVYKVGDKVKPLTGPHAGEVHSVTKVLANGSLDIVPDEAQEVKYAKGGANARPEQVELAEAVKPLSLFKKGSLFSQVLAGQQLVEKEAE